MNPCWEIPVKSFPATFCCVLRPDCVSLGVVMKPSLDKYVLSSRDRCECSAIWGCKRSGGLYLPFGMLSREHIRLARQYCVPSVECIAWIGLICIGISCTWTYSNYYFHFRMTPARRVYFSVHDVIDAIQNGESDVDMESDTSDSSDEEVVENVGSGKRDPLIVQLMMMVKTSRKPTKPQHMRCQVVWQQDSHTCHPLLALILCKRFNAGTKPPNPTLKSYCGCIQQIHGRCGFAGLICSQIQVMKLRRW